MPKLTKRVVEAAEPRADDEYFVWCDELPGFGVRVYPSGKRGYVVQYRSGGRSRRAAIGLHGRLTCEEARREAMALLGQVAKGGNPAEERATRRASITVRELCDRYLAAVAKGLILGKRGGPKKSSTIDRDRSPIARHILPLLGTRRVIDLSRSDITRFIRDVSAGKTALVEKTNKLRGKSVVEGGRGAASRTVGLLGGILSYAVSEGIIETNPVHGVKRPADQRKRVRMSAEAYRALGAVLARMESEGGYASAITALRMLALTGARKGEIERLRWSEVDRTGHALRLADSKEGASVRPLARAALDFLASVGRQGDCDYVCPGRKRNSPYAGLSSAWRRAIKTESLSGCTLHTLRHGFASVAADLGYTESTIGAMLGHSSGSVTGRYVHHLDSVLIAAADRVAAAIADQMAGTGAAPGAPAPS